MEDGAKQPGHDLVDGVCKIVSAYLARNSVPPSGVPSLIDSVHASLSAMQTGQDKSSVRKKVTPEEIKKSITPNALISFIDGKPYKSMRRHLLTHGLDPTSYRKQFGLPVDYPMVCSTYSARRSEISKQIAARTAQRG